MLVRVVVALHTGGRYNVRPHEITFDIEVPVGATTLMFDTLKRKCCEQLEGHNTLFGYNLTFCRVREGGWEALDGGRVELQQLQQQQHPGQQQLDMELCAMVVPTSLSPGPPNHPQPRVSLMEIIQGPVPWTYCTSDSKSSTDKHYDIQIEEQPWTPEVLPYLQDRLGVLTIASETDPRLKSNLRCVATCEDQTNQLVLDSVCEVVARVARELGYRVQAYKNEREDAVLGQPDFLFYLTGIRPPRPVLSGEGKIPSMLRSIAAIRPDSPKCAKRCAGQEAFYIKERDNSYGFLTCCHGTFGFVRTGEDKYAITSCVPWHKTGDGVLAHILYMLLKQIDVLNGIVEEGVWVPNGNAVQQQQQQQQQLLLQQHPLPPGVAAAAGLPAAAAAAQAGPSRQQQLGRSQQKHTVGAVAENTDSEASASAGHSTQHVQDAAPPQSIFPSSNSSSSSRMLLQPDGGYLQLERQALQLTDIVIGTSQSGTVKLGMWHGVWCAVKAADTHNQKYVVRAMKHEVGMFMRDGVKDLQGDILPQLVGCGYWKDGHLFVVATSYLDGCQKPGAATRDGLQAAKKALSRLHQQGILHGDLRRDNVLLRRLDDGTWQAYLIDLGMSHEAVAESNYQEEMRDLEDLFRESE